MAEIALTAAGPGRYEVVVTTGETRTKHTVTVPAALLEDLGVTDLDQEALVRASFEFLLEREPATAILSTFELDVIERYFPGYVEKMRGRLS
jgi:hypothetical protein